MKTYELYSNRRGTDGVHHSRTADEVERDLGNIRAEMSDTIRALEERFSGGDAVSQVLTRLRSGETSELLHTVGDVARANPVPIALILTGIGAMAFAGREGTSELGRRAAHRAGERVDELRDELRARRTTEHSSERLDELRARRDELRARGRDELHTRGEELRARRDRLRERGEELKARGEELRARGSESFERQSQRAREGVDTLSRDGRRLIEEEPLVLAGLGIALGAVIAGSIPIVRDHRERGRVDEEPEPEIIDDVFLGPRAET